MRASAEASVDRFDSPAFSDHCDGDKDGDADVERVASGSSSGTILNSDNGIAAEPVLVLMGGDVATAGIGIGVGMEEGSEALAADRVAADVVAIGGAALNAGVAAGVAFAVRAAFGAGASIGVDVAGSVTVGAGGSSGAGAGIVANVGGDDAEITGARTELAGVEIAGTDDGKAADEPEPAVGGGAGLVDGATDA